MSDQEPLNTNQELNAEHVMESLGEPREAAHDIDNAGTLHGSSNNTTESSDPLYVQKRLKQQSRQHEREMRELQAQMAAMHAHMSQGQQGTMNNSNGAVAGDDPIQKAVQFALQQRDLQEQQKQQAESQAHVQRQRSELVNHLDSMEDKYDDFRERVFNRDLPITPTMSDYAITLPRKGAGSAGEVLYHLAKNPDELKRISKLHPLDQASEMAKLSHALISGGSGESKSDQSSRAPIGNIKSMPHAVSGGITDKTSPSQIRAMMKSGNFKGR
jgi:hypothetical protein